MSINKVVYGENTLIDLTDTTANASDVASGKYFYGKDGVKTLGLSSASSYKKIGEGEFTVNTTDTTSTSIATINCNGEHWDKDKIIYVRIRDEAGPRAGYFLGTDTFFVNPQAGNGSTNSDTACSVKIYRYTANNTFEETASNNKYGLWADKIIQRSGVAINRRYNSSYSLTINGTYKVEVYALDFPDGISPYNIQN